ncbi:mitochondrial thiamine pyrophosphate carrier 1 [Bombardia bombarda]|uniref:Mitochondrial thiamine pyrophosphate carrier 1 n=1 Tax=Bombardia bombarda TaxID=252184 RepID=A0AA39WMK0_9PEZI|nr:mitochondrial thiamine pyrophosphate carrier 1 [Bombardia bombarda]
MSDKTERLKDEGSSLQHTAAGGTAGLISRFVIAPLDVVKIRLQLQTHSLSDPLSHQELRGGPIYKGTLPTIRHILRHEGLTGLWKGNVPAELLYVSYAAIQFTTYKSVTTLIDNNKHNTQHQIPLAAESFIAGAAAGGVATVATYPLDLLRTRFAAQGNDDKIYPSMRRALVQIGRDEGVRGFYRGLGSALAQIAPYMGLFFAVYETLRPHLVHLDLPYSSGGAVAGVVASVMAKTGTFPLDLVRKRIQVQGPTRGRYIHRNIPEYHRGTAATVRAIVAREGVRGLYRGLTVSLFKAAPASAVTMWTYERALKFYVALGEKGEGKEGVA